MEQQVALLIALVGEIRDLLARAHAPLHPPPKNEPTDQLLEDREVEKLLHVSNSTLRRYRDEGRIPYFKIKGRYYYSFRKLQEAMGDSYIKDTFRKLSAEDLS